MLFSPLALAPRTKTRVSLMSPGSWWPGLGPPLLYLFLNLNYSEQLDFCVPIQREGEAGCAFCYRGEAAKALSTQQSKKWAFGSSTGKCELPTQGVFLRFLLPGRWPLRWLMNSTEFWLGPLIRSPLWGAVSLEGEKCTPCQLHSCFSLYLRQPVVVWGCLPVWEPSSVLWNY